jgi:ribosomal protein L12E/L44/L45/RPP1/RPP2
MAHRTRYRYRVILEKTALGSNVFPYADTYDAALAVQVACMLQIAVGREPTASEWRGITHGNTTSITADSITMERLIMEGDMSEVMREYEAAQAAVIEADNRAQAKQTQQERAQANQQHRANRRAMP